MHTLMYPQHPVFEDMVAQLFGDVFADNKNNSKYPLTDVYEEDGVAYMEIAIAGFSKDEIDITIDNQILTISGEKLKSSEPNTRQYIKRDIAARNFEKSYSLMFQVEKIEATFNDGILKITLIPLINHAGLGKIEIK